MIAARLALAVTLAFAVSASAQAADPRLVTIPYRADVVERLDGRAGVQATIAFGDDEHIENVAIGDSDLWQVTPNKRVNKLFVKPLRPRARTNLTVVTDRHSYFFDLIAGPGESPVYFLRFSYPEPPKKPPPPAPLTNEETAIAKGKPEAMPIDPSALDFAWRTKGKPALTPLRIYDDGRDTYLSWPDRAALPAILITDEKGNEGPVNFAMRGDVVIVDGVPRRIVLRSGRDVAMIEHIGEVPAPPAPESDKLPRAPATPPLVSNVATPLATSAPARSETP